MKKTATIILFLLFTLFLFIQAKKSPFGFFFTSSKQDTISMVEPESLGMNSDILSKIDSIVYQGIQAKAFPGCQVFIMKENKIVYNKSVGFYTYDSVLSVSPETMYDLASLSKTTGTLLAVMKLYDEGKLNLSDKVSDYLIFLKNTNKENITIEELLFHESGLPASLPFHLLVVNKNNSSCLISTKECKEDILNENPAIGFNKEFVSRTESKEFPIQVAESLFVNTHTHKPAMKMIAEAHLGKKKYVYSCVNFILLKEIVEKISQIPMNEFLEKEFYNPMELNNLSYFPLTKYKSEKIAPSLKNDFLRGKIQGYVHDSDAAFLGGFSGNAGLFASAENVATVHQMLLNKGTLNKKRYLSEETCELFTNTTSLSGRRGLGFDKPVFSETGVSPCSASTPPQAYGHTGYTGTCCWVDPINEIIYVFLSNRTYPNDGENKLAKMNIRTNIQELIYQSMK